MGGHGGEALDLWWGCILQDLFGKAKKMWGDKGVEGAGEGGTVK